MIREVSINDITYSGLRDEAKETIEDNSMSSISIKNLILLIT